MTRFLSWLIGDDSLGTVPGWNTVRAHEAWASTERMLLGAWSPAKPLIDRAAIAEREQRAAAMSARSWRVVNRGRA